MNRNMKYLKNVWCEILLYRKWEKFINSIYNMINILVFFVFIMDIVLFMYFEFL